MLRGINYQLDAVLDLIPEHCRITIIEKVSFQNRRSLYEGYRKGIHQFFEGQLYKYNVDCIYLGTRGQYPTLVLNVVENIKDEED